MIWTHQTVIHSRRNLVDDNLVGSEVHCKTCGDMVVAAAVGCSNQGLGPSEPLKLVPAQTLSPDTGFACGPILGLEVQSERDIDMVPLGWTRGSH